MSRCELLRTLRPWLTSVQWAGYGSDDDTWEPEEGLAACTRLLGSFWKEIGLDDKDYPMGTVVVPTPKWIRKERARFKIDFEKGKDEKRKQKERADRRKEEAYAAKKAAKKRKQNETTSKPLRSSSSTSVPRATHKPLPSYSAPLPSTSALPKQKIVDSDSSDSDDDRPLANLQKRKTSPAAEAPLALFSPSPSPSSPEISLSSIAPNISSTNPKPKLPTRKPSTSIPSIPPKSKGPDRPSLSVNMSKAVASPSLPSAARPTPLPLPKPSIPLPSRQRPASSNAGSATSSTFPSRPFGKPATPTIPSSRKPATPTIPSTTPTIPFVKPATPTIPPSAIPAHIQRKGSAPSRGIQFLNAADPATATSMSGLSTKQRLSQAALALAPAKEAQRRAVSPDLPSREPLLHQGPTPRLRVGVQAELRIHPLRSVKPRIHYLTRTPTKNLLTCLSPRLIWIWILTKDHPFLLPRVRFRRIRSPPLSSPPRRPSQASLNAQADDLLREMVPPNSVRLPPTTLNDSLRRIQKKWKWTGKLLADLADKTDHLCDVVLNDLVPLQIEGLRINVAMASADSIHLLSFHDLVDMSDFLKTCPEQQLARLGPSTDKDAEPLKILARYMTKKSLVSLVPVFLDDRLAGHLLLFPPMIQILLKLFRVPPELAASSSLVVALLPWKEFPEKESRRPFSHLPGRLDAPIPSTADWKKNMEKSKYQLALRILKFPKSLHEWMSKSNRPYCIWPPCGDQKAPRDRETGYLMAILTQCGAKKVSFKTDIRAIFVHVGALKHIRKLPLLVERRSQTCSIRFYTYGTHETVHPEQWGIREIYPIGGVVTFTPSALYEDPWGVINTMKVIDKHPLWTCYILPSVLGMATKLSSPEEDPLVAFDRGGVFVFDLLLRAIDDGEVSVLRAPPLDRYPLKDSDPAEDWLRDHWVTRPLGPRRVLESCMDAFTPTEWASAIESEISEDLDLMQRQPDIMKHYRRYVVIRAESDDSVNADRDGFDFNDDSQKVGL
ncbi:hypothetical protein B0H17DRAFT_1089829 [Mycena rosella]|uniref:Chromo domain-containing protein n=1 Tax=Mycena rosella TaxID=1033263 RepID=A0AAD7CVV3_MYCRO|nr:hypothetical protein B0H17DRAFT_1089829 [Mycena rosella]